MTDLECQVTRGNVDPEAATARVPDHKLKKLVRTLIRSVKILQSIIDVDDKDDDLTQQEYQMQLVRYSTASEAASSEDLSIQDNVSERISDAQYGLDTSETVIATSEEILFEKKKNLEAFEAQGISKNVPSDFWRVLLYLDWSYYGSVYTVAKSRADVVSSKRHIPGIIRYHADNPDVRQEVQKLLYYGLSRWWWLNGWPTNDPTVRARGVLDMAPWVALIGIRLPKFVNGKEVDDTGAIDIRCLNILSVLLQMPNLRIPPSQYHKDHEGSFWADSLTVRQVLDECYRRKILHKPNAMTDGVLKTQIKDLVRATALVNLWHFNNYAYPRDVDPVNALDMKVSSLCMRVHDIDHWYHLPKSNATSFQCRGMSLELLRKVGKIKVNWSEYLEEHLQFDFIDSEPVLKLFWFGFSIMATPMFHIGCGNRYLCCHKFNPSQSAVFDELSKTYSLLFRSQEDTYKNNLREYGRLPIPEWVRVCYGSDDGTLSSQKAKDMSYFVKSKEPWLSDIKYHLKEAGTRLPLTEQFEDYHLWGDRLRELKAYMDDQKPRGIRSLWTDKRDTSQWYTFWAVVIIGSIGLLLTFFGLIASIAQTIGTFRGQN